MNIYQEVTEDIFTLVLKNAKYTRTLTFGGDCRPLAMDFVDENMNKFVSLQFLNIDKNNCVSNAAFLLSMPYLSILSMRDCYNITEKSIVSSLTLNSLKNVNIANNNQLSRDSILQIVSQLPALEILNCEWCHEWHPEEVFLLCSVAPQLIHLTASPYWQSDTESWISVLEKNKQVTFGQAILHMVPPTRRPSCGNSVIPHFMDDLWAKGLV